MYREMSRIATSRALQSFLLALAAVGVVLRVPPASGQDYAWAPLGSGMNDQLVALTVFDGQLLAGGAFTTAGGVTCNYIARWDSTSWAPLGSGMNGPVYALAVHNGELIAGGEFTVAGEASANYIAKWDGTTWAPLGSGMNGAVYALTVYDGELIAGGEFTYAGGVIAGHVAKWNGTDAWAPLGYGIGVGGFTRVHALTSFNDGLIVGGEFSSAGEVSALRIAQWDGTNWAPLGSGMNSMVFALHVFNAELIAGGWFTTAGGVSANRIAAWDGAGWSSLSSGFDGMYPVFVRGLATFDGELIAGGSFQFAGEVTAWRIAKWDGTDWAPLGSGMSGGVDYPVVRGLTVFNGDLIAGGDFTSAGGVSANHIAAWGQFSGACCYADGSCAVTAPADCSGVYQGDASSCEPNPCVCTGDLNCDGVVDFGDINPFVLYLSNYSGWLNEFGACHPLNGDINGDGTYGQWSFDDINPFVALLANGQGPCP